MKRIRKKRKKASRLSITTFALIILTVFYLLFISAIKHFIKPVVSAIGVSRVQGIAIRAISDAVNFEMQKNADQYQNLILFQKAEDGTITAVSSDIIKINSLKATLSEEILDRISLEATEVRIPLGNFVNSEVLSGRGPAIKFRLIPYGLVQTDVESIFSDAGINQTKYQTLVKVKTKLSILMPGSAISAQVETAVCIAEAVIVGRVPSYYTNVEQSPETEKIADDLANYGSSAQPSPP